MESGASVSPDRLAVASERPRGLSDRAQKRARELADEARLRAPREFWRKHSSVGLVTRPARDARLPPLGTVLKRKNNGDTIEVEVLATGFRYRDQVYGSLSQLAHRITGTRWNGYAFLGTAETMTRLIRCAVYTRKSTEEGLEQSFNTLQAQREAAEAYILSHQHEGWRGMPILYDDGSWSGANLERLALRRLLADVEAKQIDCVVVYKVDRLSRSLLDFMRLLSLFEKHGVSFVSVTQDFNLSFGQFEREMISERTRDKLSAARRKGKWIGGIPVLGYQVAPEGGRLLIHPGEGERVREIYQLCARARNLPGALTELRARGWTAKQWTSRRGQTHGGGPP